MTEKEIKVPEKTGVRILVEGEEIARLTEGCDLVLMTTRWEVHRFSVDPIFNIRVYSLWKKLSFIESLLSSVFSRYLIVSCSDFMGARRVIVSYNGKEEVGVMTE